MKCLHILPMNKLSGAEKLVLILCKNMKNYEPIVICGGDTLSNVFKENGIESYSMNFSIKNINYRDFKQRPKRKIKATPLGFNTLEYKLPIWIEQKLQKNRQDNK